MLVVLQWGCYDIFFSLVPPENGETYLSISLYAFVQLCSYLYVALQNSNLRLDFVCIPHIRFKMRDQITCGWYIVLICYDVFVRRGMRGFSTSCLLTMSRSCFRLFTRRRSVRPARSMDPFLGVRRVFILAWRRSKMLSLVPIFILSAHFIIVIKLRSWFLL